MKIKAPDDDDCFSEDKARPGPSEVKYTFQDEIEDLLKIPKMSSMFFVDGPVSDTPEYKLQVLRKFTELCREEIIPCHNKAVETIESKLETLHFQQEFQQKEVAYLTATSRELKENNECLEAKKAIVQKKQQELDERMKETLQQLLNHCKNKTVAERKMGQDLVNLQKKADNLEIGIKETSAKVNYFSTQTKSQIEIVKKRMKPLYLDKNRSTFIKTNLNSTRISIAELVHRVKKLKAQMSELVEPNYSENVSQN